MLKTASILIAFETRSSDSTGAQLPAVYHVCEKLRPQLATLMGAGGYCAVLARALAVSRGQVPWIEDVGVAADGSLEGWDGPEIPSEPKKLEEGGVILTAQLLGLLVAFIGENLAFRMLREVWPKLSLEDIR